MGVTIQADGWLKPDDPRDASIRQTPDGRYEMRFERDVPRPPEKVWAALTTPEHLAEWLGEPIQIDPRVGGKFIVAFPGGREDLVETTILAFDPPRMLVLEWGESRLRWQMTPTAAGCHLVFAQDGLDPRWLMGGAAGWMGMIDDIVSIACGGGAKDIEGGYPAAVERYRRDYGPYSPGHDAPPGLHDPEGRAFVMREGDGRYMLRYSRRYRLPIERLWAALTEPARLADWLGVAAVDLSVGGAVEIRWPTQAAVANYIIRELTPPMLLRWGAPDDPSASVRWRLIQEDPDFAGVRIVLTETGVPARELLSIATGWHACLHDLAAAAQREEPLPWSADREAARIAREKAELEPGYRERLARDAPDALAAVEETGR